MESRLMLHAFAPVIPVADISRPTADTPDVIDLSQSFNTTTNPTRVAFGFDLGRVVVELFDTAAPRTVANFLNYSRTERFDNTVIHRSAILGAPSFSPFVIQGGGYAEADLTHIPTFDPVLNEFRPNTVQRGTIAMAKVGNNPNSATSEWFFNLRDNKDILDNQNGGFTSFGQVLGNGMRVVDAIAALPVTVQTAPAGPLSDFPIENFPPAPPQDYVNLQYLAELPELTGATSDNTGLVTPVLQGTTLTLNYTAGATGIANITVNALDRSGAPVQDVFQVRVGGVNVSVGEGTPAQTISYTDADGTAGLITVKGGSATVSFTGTGLTQTPASRNVAVAGAAELYTVNVTSGTPTITVRGTGGADARLVANGINGGAIRSFTGREVILRGTSNIQQGIGKLDLFQTQNAGITIGASVDGKLQPTITLGSAQDTDINSAAPLKTVRVGSWTSTDTDPDVIAAPSLRTLQSNGAFSGDLTIGGASAAKTLGTVRIAGPANGTWTVAGAVGNITAQSTAATWNANFANYVTTLAVAGDLSGRLSAAGVRSVRAGSMTVANLNLVQPTAAGAIALGTLNSKGAITNSVIRAAASDIRSITAAAIIGSSIYAGMGLQPGQLPGSDAPFIAPATIRSVTVRNRTGPSFVGSVIAASTLGKMNLGIVSTANGGVPMGIAGQTILSVTGADQTGQLIRLARLTEPNQTQQRPDFYVLVY